MVGDDNYAAMGVLKGIMAAPASLPLKACPFSHLTQLLIGNQAEFTQADTSTRQVPTKSGSDSSGEAVFRYTEIASLMFDSRDGRSGAWV